LRQKIFRPEEKRKVTKQSDSFGDKGIVLNYPSKKDGPYLAGGVTGIPGSAPPCLEGAI